MDATLETKLIQCLDSLENGESLDQVLARYPHDADQLRPLLETSVQLADMRLAYSVGARSKSREMFLKEASLLRDGPARPWLIFGGFRRLALTLSSAALVGILVLAILIGISASSIPGDAFYGTKLTVEEIRLILTNDLEARRTLGKRYEMERLREIQSLLEADREADVTFSGTIERIQDDVWIVAGLPVATGPETDLNLEPEIGALALVMGRTEDGVVKAVSITIVGISEPRPQPSPTPEIRITLTVTERPRLTPSSTPSQGGQESVMPSDDAGSMPSETDTPSPSPTYTPTPTDLPPIPTEDGSDGNNNEGNDEGNENDGEQESNENEEEDESNENEEEDEDNENEEEDEGNDNEEPDESNENEEEDESNENEEPDEGNENEEPDEGNENEEEDESNENEELDKSNENEEPDESNENEKEED